MNKVKLIYEYLQCPIPNILNIDGKIFSNIEIADNVCNGRIPLRESSIDYNYKNYESLWQEKSKTLSELDNNALFGLNILNNLLIAYKQTNDEKYVVAINNHLKSFFTWLDDKYSKLDRFNGAIYNRTYVLINIVSEIADKLESYTLINDLLEKYQVQNIIKFNNTGGLSTRISKGITLLILGILYSNEAAVKASENIIKDILVKHLDDDGLVYDLLPLNSRGYLNILKQYKTILKSFEIEDEYIISKIDRGLETLGILTNQNNYYPMIDVDGNNKSAVNTVNASKWLKQSDIAIFKNEDIYCLYKCSSKSLKYNHCDCGSLIFTYKNREIFIDSGHNLEDMREYCESVNGHSLPVFSNMEEMNPTTYWETIDKEDSQIISYQPLDNNDIFSCVSKISTKFGVIKREINYYNNSLNINDSFTKSLDGNLKVRFILHFDSREIVINNNEVKFYIHGLIVKIKVTTKTEKMKIDIENACYCKNNTTVKSTNAIVFMISHDKESYVNFNITFDENEIGEYIRNEDSFIKGEIEEQLENTLLSNVVDDFIKYCNIGSTEIYRYGRKAYLNHDYETAKKCEILNSILHNSSIKSTCEIGKGTKLAYGGIGLLIHAYSQIGKYCVLGASVTLAAKPKIGDFVYISTGARLIGRNLKVGSFSIIAANAVVNKDVEPFSIVGGVPAKIINKITPDNVEKYLVSYLASTGKTDSKFVEYVRNEFHKYYEEYNKKDKNSTK